MNRALHSLSFLSYFKIDVNVCADGIPCVPDLKLKDPLLWRGFDGGNSKSLEVIVQYIVCHSYDSSVCLIEGEFAINHQLCMYINDRACYPSQK